MVLYESVLNKGEKLNIELDWHEEPAILYFKNGRYRLTLNLKEYDISYECVCVLNAGSMWKLESLGDRGNEYLISFDYNEICFHDETDEVNRDLILPLIRGERCFNQMISVSDFGFLDILKSINDTIRRFREFGKKRPVTTAASLRYDMKSVSDKMMLRSDLLRILALFEIYGMVRDAEFTDTERQIKAVKDAICYIRSHYQEKIYIRDLSELTGLNEQYFIRFFGSVTGIPPLDYINRYRVEQAGRMLRETDAHAYEIAEGCGFHNIGNFIKIFRSFTGVTPHKYRKNIGKNDD